MNEQVVRCKVVKIDNLEITISELNFDQIQAYLAPIAGSDDLDDAARADALRTRSFEMICNSLNNVLMASIMTPDTIAVEATWLEKNTWTVARFRAKYGVVTYRKLNEEILTFSGLTLGEQPVGGASAAVDQTLATSAPALQPQPASAGGK